MVRQTKAPAAAPVLTTAMTRVEAGRASVLDVIADFAAYPQWVPYLTTADVEAVGHDGFPSRVRFVMDAGALADDYSLVYDWKVPPDVAAPAVVSWQLARGRAIKAMRGYYRLGPAVGEPSTTDVEYGLAVDLMLPLVTALRRKAERMVIDTALGTLKSRVESLGIRAERTGDER